MKKRKLEREVFDHPSKLQKNLPMLVGLEILQKSSRNLKT